MKLTVKGMTCGHCERAVEKALTGVPGVDRVVRVSHKAEEAIVEGAADPVALCAAVAGEGFEATAVNDG